MDKYIKEGDNNTKIFHATTLCRWHKNNFKWFKNENGDWINSHKELASTLGKFFEDLFSSKNKTVPIPYGLINPINSEEVNNYLIDIPTSEEIRESLFSIGHGDWIASQASSSSILGMKSSASLRAWFEPPFHHISTTPT